MLYIKLINALGIGGSRDDSRLILCLLVSSVIKTTDDLERSNNARTDECKHSSTEQWRENLVKLRNLRSLRYRTKTP